MLYRKWAREEEFALTIRMLAALAFVPPNDIIDSFDTLENNSRNGYGQDLDDMLDYFEDDYIGSFRHNTPRRRPTFSTETWNMFHRKDNELPRTNNRLKDDIAVSNRTLGFATHHFGNSSVLWNKRKKLLELVYFKIKEGSHDRLNEGDVLIIMREL